ncbi:acyl-CoA carboxylase subunit beta [Conexibacter sp. W3-3-2]|jgi:acyl-CoA carboxylase subunit beta|uniref:acyl-CoA carboxylase subunit beta n=1 Tax=Conexibacter sp. W3-3-2 TaxID=2675227 RepID=UPI0012B8B0C2|nr:carboxyl transferase domain-containing protein [Conexibacter sp. W3-3-2]MTD43712.1 acyl-CoA carboxylase subunit beta [Conexibacter sp. W3-3-2]
MPATVLQTAIDTRGETYLGNRESLLRQLDDLDAAHAAVREGGGSRYVERHRQRGKLLVRERLDLLLDQDSPFLELSPLAGWGTDFPVGGNVVTGIGHVEGVECAVIAHDPTLRGGALNPVSFRKLMRMMDIARENRLPLINLVESGGGDLPTQLDVAIPGGAMYRDLAKLSQLKIPTIALVFGNATAGGAYFPGMCDYTVFVKGNAKVFLGGPPLVKMATGEESDDESLGGADMHARVSGLADFMALDEPDCLRLGREIVRNLNWRKAGPGPVAEPDEPRHAPEELLGIASADLTMPFDPREVLARVVDGSRFDEFKPRYGINLVTGWATIHGFRVGVLANDRGILFSEEARKATQFIQLANQIDVPLLFIQNTTGFMVGEQYEQGGIIKDGARMINAVSNSKVPHLTLVAGAAYGAGVYAMSGRAFNPRFMFTWPNAKSAVMGPAQLAGVLSIVARASAEARGVDFDLEADAVRAKAVEDQIESESLAPMMSGRLYDDAIVDPRDTRTVLGFALSCCHSAPVEGAPFGFGVFRM